MASRVRIFIVLCGLSLGSVCATAAEVLPVYQRTRSVAWEGAGLGGPAFLTQPGWLWPGQAGFWPGAGFAPVFQTGSWYQRPYPHHFDYYRGRFAAPALEQTPYPCEMAAPWSNIPEQVLPGPQ